MALTTQVTITDDATGRVTETFVESYASDLYAYHAAANAKALLCSAFQSAYPGSEEW